MAVAGSPDSQQAVWKWLSMVQNPAAIGMWVAIVAIVLIVYQTW